MLVVVLVLVLDTERLKSFEDEHEDETANEFTGNCVDFGQFLFLDQTGRFLARGLTPMESDYFLTVNLSTYSLASTKSMLPGQLDQRQSVNSAGGNKIPVDKTETTGDVNSRPIVRESHYIDIITPLEPGKGRT